MALAHILLPMCVTIRNHQPGVANSSIDAHDGPILQWKKDGPFYRYAMAYTRCDLVGTGLRGTCKHYLNRFIETVKGRGFDCAQVANKYLSDGFGNDCGFLNPANGQTVLIHRSWDLKTWELVGDALANAPDWLRYDSIIFRPGIVFSPSTERYVLWLNRLPRATPIVDAFRQAGFVVGTASVPEGPFDFSTTVERATPLMAHAGGADFALLSVEDEAFIAYGAWYNMGITSGWRTKVYLDHMLETHQIAIQRLDKSFTRPIGEAVTVSKHGQEAPSFFSHSGYYYLIYGNTCCFCRMGSDASVYVAKDPMGPFSYAGSLNSFGQEHVPAQNSGILQVVQTDGSKLVIWRADMWLSSNSGLKGNDLQYWHPLTFVARNVAGLGHDIPVPERREAWLESFDIDIIHLGVDIHSETCIDGNAAREGQCEGKSSV